MNGKKGFDGIMRCAAIILSGGTGSRMNMDIPKQYIEVDNRMIITESIRPFLECGIVSDLRIVADKMWQDKIIDEYRVLSRDYFGDDSFFGLYKFMGFSSPGENRQLSIFNALCDIKSDWDEDGIVIIHDAARPLVTVGLIETCIAALMGIDSITYNEFANSGRGINSVVHDGVMPVLPMKDTVYLSEDGKAVSSLLNRDKLFAGQAPEVYKIDRYLEACKKLLPDKIMDIRGSTEPAVMDGMDVVMVAGDEGNFKITTREDLDRYREILELRRL